MTTRVVFEHVDGRTLANYPAFNRVPQVGEEFRRTHARGDWYRIDRVVWTGNNSVTCVVDTIGEG